LALANGFKLVNQGMAGIDLEPPVYAFANALLAEHKSWQPLTSKMLEQFELEGSGECFLIDDDDGFKLVGVYEWRQGRNPHGFSDSDGRWYSASDFTKIMINP
jgi:hypothetical protein